MAELKRIVGSARESARILTRDVIRQLLEFHTSWAVTSYLSNKAQVHYDDLEVELHNRYPIQGVGIRAHRGRVSSASFEDGGLLVENQPMPPEDAVGELWRFPIDAASTTYSFALFEVFGNDLAEICTGISATADWHRAISPRFDRRDPNHVRSATNQLAQSFGVPTRRVTLRLLGRVARLKALRNRIVHEGASDVHFTAALGEMVGVVCELHFMCVPSEREIVVYPWSDFENNFHPTTPGSLYFRRS